MPERRIHTPMQSSKERKHLIPTRTSPARLGPQPSRKSEDIQKHIGIDTRVRLRPHLLYVHRRERERGRGFLADDGVLCQFKQRCFFFLNPLDCQPPSVLIAIDWARADTPACTPGQNKQHERTTCQTLPRERLHRRKLYGESHTGVLERVLRCHTYRLTCTEDALIHVEPSTEERSEEQQFFSPSYILQGWLSLLRALQTSGRERSGTKSTR